MYLPSIKVDQAVKLQQEHLSHIAWILSKNGQLPKPYRAGFGMHGSDPQNVSFPKSPRVQGSASHSFQIPGSSDSLPKRRNQRGQ